MEWGRSGNARFAFPYLSLHHTWQQCFAVAASLAVHACQSNYRFDCFPFLPLSTDQYKSNTEDQVPCRCVCWHFSSSELLIQLVESSMSRSFSSTWSSFKTLSEVPRRHSDSDMNSISSVCVCFYVFRQPGRNPSSSPQQTASNEKRNNTAHNRNHSSSATGRGVSRYCSA